MFLWPGEGGWEAEMQGRDVGSHVLIYEQSSSKSLAFLVNHIHGIVIRTFTNFCEFKLAEDMAQ